jgi:flagellar biosynthesis protein
MTRKDSQTYQQTDIAVALSYDGRDAPRVTASGRDGVAKRILEVAEQAGVPQYPSPELAPILAQVPIGDEIPEALYRAVAEVIAFAYLVAGKVPEGFEKASD